VNGDKGNGKRLGIPHHEGHDDHPGSDLFVVYSDGRTTLSRGFPDVENRSFVVKITRLFRF
jgi:hypothetical protein